MSSNPAIVILPTYNEAENLPVILDNLLMLSGFDIMVVDDNSPDGTGNIADEYALKDERILVLHRQEKQGLGEAYKHAFARARFLNYSVLIEMDADGSHPYQSLPRMIELSQQYDIVLGSRWIPGGDVHNWSKSRELMSRAGNLYMRALLGLPAKDASGGFRAYRSEVFDKVHLNEIVSHGYCFQMDIVMSALLAGFSVAEFPITFVDRVRGQSKMDMSIALESLARISAWAFTRSHKYAGEHVVLPK